MQTEKIILTTTLQAATALARFRLVNFAGGQAVAGERAVGVSNAAYDVGEQAGVSARGEMLVEAGAAIARGAAVQADATGRAITLAAGVQVGEARDAATAAGEFIRITR